eukprot:4414288-Pyramimonas_sp.AAC.1
MLARLSARVIPGQIDPQRKSTNGFTTAPSGSARIACKSAARSDRPNLLSFPALTELLFSFVPPARLAARTGGTRGCERNA